MACCQLTSAAPEGLANGCWLAGAKAHWHPESCHSLGLWESLSSPRLCHCLAFQGSDDEEEGQKVPPPPETPMPPPLPPTPDQVIVRKDYDPKGRACLSDLVLLKKVLYGLVCSSDGLFLPPSPEVKNNLLHSGMFLIHRILYDLFTILMYRDLTNYFNIGIAVI